MIHILSPLTLDLQLIFIWTKRCHKFPRFPMQLIKSSWPPVACHAKPCAMCVAPSQSQKLAVKSTIWYVCCCLFVWLILT